MKMKYLILFIIFVGNLVFAGEIEVRVKNIKNDKGFISLGLYDSDKNFLDSDHVFAGNFIKAKSGSVVYTFKDIPSGNYAIAVYHDENSNMKLDQNFIGIPKKGYGFSNNAESIFGPPRFKKCMFNLKEKIKLDINLKY